MSNALRIGNRSINAAAVSLEDQLSDHIYHYDGKDRVFEKECGLCPVPHRAGTDEESCQCEKKCRDDFAKR